MKVVLAEKPSVARELASFLGASTPGGLFRGERLPGDLGPGAPGDPEGAARLRPGPEEVVAGGAAFVPERFGIKPIEEGGASSSRWSVGCSATRTS